METFEQRKHRAQKLLRALKKAYPRAKIALRYGNNIQLLMAVILSAQCTDKKVNEVTATLFKKYRTAKDFARANPKVFEQEIRSTGFYRAKAKNILGAAKMLVGKFHGSIPKTMVEITELPGVARKTANIVLGNAYGVVEGMAVDTHVKKFAQVCRLSDSDNPEKIEQDLMKLFPKKEWFLLTYRIVDHGRDAHKKEHKYQPCAIREICGDPKF